MNKRFCKQGRKWLGALCVVSVCGAMYSCTDEYDLDDGSPSWLNSSIYDYLQTSGKYTNFVNLIDDLEYSEVLDKTGSKTLFVADDDAFAEFYQNNPWGVSKYSDLSKSQKKLLMNTAMINNAYLLEMMSSTADNGDTDTEPQKGRCLRRNTASSVIDSIAFFGGDQLPVTYNATDKDYWGRFRKSGIHMALDATDPMMTHFLEAQLKASNITNNDFATIMGVERQSNDAYIYDAKVMEADIRCQNGYVNRLSKVLVTPQNMAEKLRTNGETNVFSHMLDRFSAPFYNEDLTARYKLVYGNAVDSIYEKRYFSSRSQGNASLKTDKGTDLVNNPAGSSVSYYLDFDPGWNSYVDDGKDKSAEEDMAVIFAPTDQALYDYFYKTDDAGNNVGAGRFLIDAYAPDAAVPQNATDYETFYKAIDQIPISVIQALINNLMKPSFRNAVPSKFISNVKNDAQDPMLTEEDVQNLDQLVKKVEIANNGIIYMMNTVITPAKYTAVSAPAYVANDMHIFNWAIQRGSSSASAALTEKLGHTVVNYYAYLLAMSSRFSFFVPKDEGFYYVDPVSFKNATVNSDSTALVGRVLHYTWNEAKAIPECTAYKYSYSFATGQGEIGDKIATSAIPQGEWGDRLRDMLESHTIVHSDNSSVSGIDETATGIECNKHYFLAKNYAPLYVKNTYSGDANSRRLGMEIQGAMEAQSNQVRTVIRFDDKTDNGNGMAYQIDAPITPTIESVYSQLYSNQNNGFGEFFNLCLTDGEVLEEIGITSTSEKNRYEIFVDNGGLPCYDKNTYTRVESATNVRFFKNFNYTVYAPTDAAIAEAVANGLPTWQSIREFLELDKEEEDRTELTDEELAIRNEKALKMVTVLVNFVKYHFQDNSVFADNPVISPTEYETATINSSTGLYCKVKVGSSGNGTLTVTDATGKSCNVTDTKNLLARDYVVKSVSVDGKSCNVISASSFAVVHGIDGVLNFKTYEGGYDALWNDSNAAKEYMAKYRILK